MAEGVRLSSTDVSGRRAGVRCFFLGAEHCVVVCLMRRVDVRNIRVVYLCVEGTDRGGAGRSSLGETVHLGLIATSLGIKVEVIGRDSHLLS